jgi:hypothetical protein
MNMFTRMADKLMPGRKETDDKKYKSDIAKEINEEYARRQNERRPFELQWRLNIEFINGNQYLNINPTNNRIEEIPRYADYQEREVFNQIAPIHETRVARLTRHKPMLKTRPATSDDEDVSAAKISSQLLQSTWYDQDMDPNHEVMVNWLEATGTVFYKPVWNKLKGRLMVRQLVPDPNKETVYKDDGKTQEEIKTEGYEQETGEDLIEMELREGDIETAVVPSFEIYPDSSYRDGMKQVRSFIHARAYHVDDIEDMWDVRVKPEDVDVMTMQQQQSGMGGIGYQIGGFRASVIKMENAAIVKEYYEMPSKRYPEGRFIVVAGDQVLHVGKLPYRLGQDGEPELPLIRITSIPKTGCFWGTTVVERCIPIQRRYNAVRNRKADYLNRVAIGQWTAVEGSVDDESQLNDEPGNILWYKPGFQPPQPVQFPNLPNSFENEVMQLEKEFTAISGVSELSRYSEAPSGVKSGVALSIANEQDDTRISLTSGAIADGVVKLGKFWLRLYRQFVSEPRLLRAIGPSKEVEVKEWSASDLRSDDVIIENSSALSETPAQRRQMVFDLVNLGVFNREEQNPFSSEGRKKILELIELGNWEQGLQDTEQLHIAYARKENHKLMSGMPIMINDFDEHNIHLEYHNRFRMSAEYEAIKNSPMGEQLEMMMQQHIAMHQQAIQQQQMVQMQQQLMMQQLQQAQANPKGGDAAQ